MFDDLAYLVALNQIREIGSVRFFKLFEKYKDIEKVFNFKREDLVGLRLSEEMITNIIKVRDSINIKKEFEKVVKQNVMPLSFFSKEYPECLKQIYAPPYLIYAKGKIELLKKENWLAIVGTRHPSFYGLKMTISFSQELVQNGWGVVSGLAKGIDAKAHETVIKQGGQTIAVLGCGIDIIYPYENWQLYKQLEKQGLIVSEMPMGVQPQSFQFPLRNRIITGLAKGTLVIEGDYKSGAMISGKLALDQNREVFALPGRVTDKTSNGPNWLLKQGAKPVVEVGDILEEFGEKKPVIKTKIESKEKTNVKLSPEEEKVCQVLSDIDSQNIEYLSEKTSISITELMMVLSGLEIKHVIKQLPGKEYILC
ncbi:MAG: DNA-processing protein DprA [Candidatus Margulisbacteria bacterium]|nr:DNA-processing protein DprA [Candidatus Margulisiibacteriota bacterium]